MSIMYRNRGGWGRVCVRDACACARARRCSSKTFYSSAFLRMLSKRFSCILSHIDRCIGYHFEGVLLKSPTFTAVRLRLMLPLVHTRKADIQHRPTGGILGHIWGNAKVLY
jgi:hypothetical protein